MNDVIKVGLVECRKQQHSSLRGMRVVTGPAVPAPLEIEPATDIRLPFTGKAAIRQNVMAVTKNECVSLHERGQCRD